MCFHNEFLSYLWFADEQQRLLKQQLRLRYKIQKVPAMTESKTEGSVEQQIKLAFKVSGLKTNNLLFKDILSIVRTNEQALLKLLKEQQDRYENNMIMVLWKDRQERNKQLQDFLVWLKDWTDDGIVVAKFEGLLGKGKRLKP
jgi:hypothetical protein